MLQLTKTDYDNILESLNRITFDPETSDLVSYRKMIINTLSDIFGYTRSLFWTTDEKGQLVDPIFNNIEDRVLYDYFETFHAYDVLAPINIPNLVSTSPILKIEDIMPYTNFMKTDFSAGFFEKYGYSDEMGIYIYNKTDIIGVIGLVRKKEEGFFQERDRNRLRFLVKSIENAFNADKLISRGNREATTEEKLTKRERELVELLQQGLSNREIGDTLYISINTVKKHLQNLYQKLEVENRTELCYRLARLRL